MEDISGSALSEGSLELAPQDKEGKGANPKELPLGFWEIAECLTAGGTLQGRPLPPWMFMRPV